MNQNGGEFSSLSARCIIAPSSCQIKDLAAAASAGLMYWRASPDLCLSAGGAAESPPEGEEWPAVQDGGGPGGPERADEEAQGCCCPGLSLFNTLRFMQINPLNYSWSDALLVIINQ